MKRLVFLLAACGSAPQPKPQPQPKPTAAPIDTRISLESWIERWHAARACVVAPADDLESGVALAWRLGRDCKELLNALFTEVRFHESLYDMWRLTVTLMEQVYGETQSASARAQSIRDVDATLEAFATFEREGGVPPPSKE